MRKLRNAFVTGFLVLVPVLATVDILRWFIRFLEAGTRTYLPTNLLPFDFWGLGLLISLMIILVTGILAQNYFGTWLIRKIDRLMRKFPLIGGIYSAIKKFLETIFNPASTQFKQAVLIEFPREGVFSIGFLTGPVDSAIQDKRKESLVNVFIPLVPNPISGYYLVVPKDEVIPLDISVQDAFKICISMGIVGAEHEPKEERRRRR